MFIELLNDNVLLVLTNRNMSGSSAFRFVKIKQSCTCMLQIYKIFSIGIHSIGIHQEQGLLLLNVILKCPVENFHFPQNVLGLIRKTFKLKYNNCAVSQK